MVEAELCSRMTSTIAPLQPSRRSASVPSKSQIIVRCMGDRSRQRNVLCEELLGQRLGAAGRVVSVVDVAENDDAFEDGVVEIGEGFGVGGTGEFGEVAELVACVFLICRG